MGKKRNNNDKSILTISFNPEDIVVIASGKDSNGIPSVKCAGFAPVWHAAISEFNNKMDSSNEGYAVIRDFIDFAVQESVEFVKHLLDFFNPGFIAIPAKEELEELIYGENDMVDSSMSLTFHFAEIMHQTIISMAQDRKIHFFIVPFSTDFASNMDKSRMSNTEMNFISLLYVTKAVDIFMHRPHKFVGSGTIIPWMPDEDENDVDVDYKGKSIITVHFSTNTLATVRDTNGKTTNYEFSDIMRNDNPMDSDRERRDVESIIDEMKSNFPDEGIIFIESEPPRNGTPTGMSYEHLEDLLSYAIQDITAEALTKGLYVIIFPRSNRIAEFEKAYPVETGKDDEYIHRAECFMKKHPILPGIATII